LANVPIRTYSDPTGGHADDLRQVCRARSADSGDEMVMTSPHKDAFQRAAAAEADWTMGKHLSRWTATRQKHTWTKHALVVAVATAHVGVSWTNSVPA
jgi:hypothetical protein